MHIYAYSCLYPYEYINMNIYIYTYIHAYIGLGGREDQWTPQKVESLMDYKIKSK
jgi:hypothetical protein